MGQSTWGRLWQFCLAFWPEPWLAPSSLLVLTQPSAHPASTPSATQTPSPQQGQQLTYFQEVDSQEDLPTTCFQPPPAYFRPVVTQWDPPSTFCQLVDSVDHPELDAWGVGKYRRKDRIIIFLPSCQCDN